MLITSLVKLYTNKSLGSSRRTYLFQHLFIPTLIYFNSEKLKRSGVYVSNLVSEIGIEPRVLYRKLIVGGIRQYITIRAYGRRGDDDTGIPQSGGVSIGPISCLQQQRQRDVSNVRTDLSTYLSVCAHNERGRSGEITRSGRSALLLKQ